MTFEFTEKFKKMYGGLPKPLQKKVAKTFRLLEQNIRHPSLQSEPVEGLPGIFRARVDIHYRISYERISGGLRIRAVGKHDLIDRNP